MIVIQDVLISDEILEEEFHCNLSACKGACCWEGDYGAPVTKSEMQTIKNILPKIEPYLSETSKNMIHQEQAFTHYTFSDKSGIWGTSLQNDGSCIFLVRDELGIAKCSFENAYKNGETDFRKPISCHLYPIRVSANDIAGFEAWNYDRWEICSAACTLGKQKKMPVFRFVKDAIIRLKGPEFYDELEAAYEHLRQNKTT